MWFADIGQVMAWILLAGWAGVVVLAATLARLGPGAVPTIPRPALRLPVVIGTGTAATLFAAQAGVVDAVADHAGPGALDQLVWEWFVTHRDPALTTVMKAVSMVGGTAGMAVLALVGATLLWRARRRAEAAVVLVATLGAGLLVTAFKNLYGRARPPVAERLAVETNASLPSGHALGSMVVLGVLVAIVVLLARRTTLRVAAVAAGSAAIVLIGTSRLYLGVHWTSDVLTGWLLGGAWLALCLTALALLRHRSTVRSTTTTTTATATAIEDGGGNAGAAATTR